MNVARKNGGVAIEPMPLRIAVSPIIENTEQHELTGSEIGTQWRQSNEYWDKLSNWYIDRQSREMKRERFKNAVYSSLASEGKTITLTGFGSRVYVKRGNLVVQNGRTYSTQEDTETVLFRAIHGVSTLIIISNSGNLTIDALQWCASQNITIRILNNRGILLATIFPASDAPVALGYPNHFNRGTDIRLRRLQYALQPSGRDVILAREIILRKLHAQLACVEKHHELGNVPVIQDAIKILSGSPTPITDTIPGIRLLEARASQKYFSAFQGIPLQLDEKAMKMWPPKWRIIGERNSQLTRFMSPRNAVHPFHALLNFCLSILESQTRSALNSIGADICVGILHADKENRDSLIYDILEPLRGILESMLLDCVKTHVFSVGDFQTTVTGQVTIVPQLCRLLAEQIKLTQRRVDEEAYWFKMRLFELMQ